MVLPSLLARVRSGSKVVGGELDQTLLLGVLANQVFGQIAGGGFNILLAEFEPFVAEDEGSSEDGFVDLVIAKRSLAIPRTNELEPFRNSRQRLFLLRHCFGDRRRKAQKQQTAMNYPYR